MKRSTSIQELDSRNRRGANLPRSTRTQQLSDDVPTPIRSLPDRERQSYRRQIDRMSDNDRALKDRAYLDCEHDQDQRDVDIHYDRNREYSRRVSDRNLDENRRNDPRDFDRNPDRSREYRRRDLDLGTPDRNSEYSDISPDRNREYDRRYTDISPARNREYNRRFPDISPDRNREYNRRDSDISRDRNREYSPRDLDRSSDRTREYSSRDTDISPDRKREYSRRYIDIGIPDRNRNYNRRDSDNRDFDRGTDKYRPNDSRDFDRNPDIRKGYSRIDLDIERSDRNREYRGFDRNHEEHRRNDSRDFDRKYDRKQKSNPDRKPDDFRNVDRMPGRDRQSNRGRGQCDRDNSGMGNRSDRRRYNMGTGDNTHNYTGNAQMERHRNSPRNNDGQDSVRTTDYVRRQERDGTLRNTDTGNPNWLHDDEEELSGEEQNTDDYHQRAERTDRRPMSGMRGQRGRNFQQNDSHQRGDKMTANGGRGRSRGNNRGTNRGNNRGGPNRRNERGTNNAVRDQHPIVSDRSGDVVTEIILNPNPSTSINDTNESIAGAPDTLCQTTEKQTKSVKNKKKKSDKQDFELDKDVGNPIVDDGQRTETEEIERNINAEKVMSKGPKVNDVFKFIVRQMGGQGTPDHIAREYGGFPLDMDVAGWFRKQHKSFLTIERGGEIINVLPFRNDAQYCFDYLSKIGCQKADCNKYHVCKNYLCGHCIFNPCKFSHDFLDSHNMAVSRKLGFADTFSNEEIFSIIEARYPHACEDWNTTGCNNLRCTKLHICKQYIFGKCLADDGTCERIHDKFSDHNKPIVDAHKMSNCPDGLFRRLVYSRRDDFERPQEDSTCKVDAMSHYICTWSLTGRCNRKICTDHHLRQKRLPYLWQVKLNEEWMTLDQSEDIEKQFSQKADLSSFVLEKDGETWEVEVVFGSPHSATATSIGGNDRHVAIEARRLTTRSYMNIWNFRPAFLTEWRWYLKTDSNEWEAFETNMQFTIESKYLAKQEEYLYTNENNSIKFKMIYKDMKLLNIDNRKENQVIRRPVFVSSDQIQQRHYPESLGSPPENITSPPKGWFPWDLCRPFEFVEVRQDSKQYRDVETSFRQSLPTAGIEIDSICRVQNQRLWNEFENRERAMKSALEVSNTSHKGVNKRYLFHGTDKMEAIHGIATNNFDFRICGQNGTAYGKGAYFHKNAFYCHRFTDSVGSYRYMFRACVLAGEYTTGKSSYSRPPTKPGSSNQLFDSCVDNEDDPSIFVLFEMAQYYPEYLIQYHDKQNAPQESDN